MHLQVSSFVLDPTREENTRVCNNLVTKNLKVLTLRDTLTNLVTKKMKMNARFSFIPVELDLKCNLEDARCVDGNGATLKLK